MLFVSVISFRREVNWVLVERFIFSFEYIDLVRLFLNMQVDAESYTHVRQVWHWQARQVWH